MELEALSETMHSLLRGTLHDACDRLADNAREAGRPAIVCVHAPFDWTQGMSLCWPRWSDDRRVEIPFHPYVWNKLDPTGARSSVRSAVEKHPRLMQLLTRIHEHGVKAGWDWTRELSWFFMSGPTIAPDAWSLLSSLTWDEAGKRHKPAVLLVSSWADWLLTPFVTDRFDLVDVSFRTIIRSQPRTHLDFAPLTPQANDTNLLHALYRWFLALPNEASALRADISKGLLVSKGFKAHVTLGYPSLDDLWWVTVRRFEPSGGFR